MRTLKKEKMTAEQKQVALGTDVVDMLAKKGADGDGALYAEELHRMRVKPGKRLMLRLSTQLVCHVTVEDDKDETMLFTEVMKETTTNNEYEPFQEGNIHVFKVWQKKHV